MSRTSPSPATRPPRRLIAARRLAVLAVAAVLVAACGSSPATGPAGTPTSVPTAAAGSSGSPAGSASAVSPASPAASIDNDAVFASIEAQVQEIRQLSQKTPVARKILDETQLSALITDSFDKSNPAGPGRGE